MPPDGLRDDLAALFGRLRADMRERWDRDLPAGELLVDRWERARSLGFGDGTSIYGSSYVYGRVTVGERTWIGPNTILDGTGGLSIGSNCSISAGVQIYTHDIVAWAVSGGTSDYEHGPVEIGDCCYLGPQTVVARGVAIGAHTVVGACSFVNRALPPHSVAVGTPCRVIGKVVLEDGGARIELDDERR
jgi:acetyltransferase-like isoleucine patch superfamily enzyme